MFFLFSDTYVLLLYYILSLSFVVHCNTIQYIHISVHVPHGLKFALAQLGDESVGSTCEHFGAQSSI